MTTVLVLLLFWIIFNLTAPLAVVATSRRMNWGNLPAEILDQASVNRVKFYRAPLIGGYAFTVWSWPNQLVVINDHFLKLGSPAMIRYVLAHELGHCVLGHTWRKWLAVVSGFILLPWSKGWVNRNEDQADEYAEKLSGVSRSVLQGK